MRWRDVKQKKVSTKLETKHKKELKDQIKYASIPSKVKAFIIDSFLLATPIIYLVMYIVIGSKEKFQTNMLMGWVYILVPLCVIVVAFLYKSGQTPGYKSQDIKLVDSKTQKEPSLLLIILRFWLFILSLVSIIGILLPFFRKDKKALHDILSSTSVIKL